MSTASAISQRAISKRTVRPILFTGEMVRAILEERKTQTRRLAKFIPLNPGLNLQASSLGVGDYFTGAGESGKVLRSMDGSCWQDRTERLFCPYGHPGDMLWVRETFQPIHGPDLYPDWKTGRGYHIVYPASEGRVEYYDTFRQEITERCKPGIHMPRWASRVTLELTKVHVERVQEISEADIIAEGTQRGNVNRQGKISDCWRWSFADPPSTPNAATAGKQTRGCGCWSLRS
jgi:hypothetical protein